MAMNCNHFQLTMLAYNLNCWLMLFHREEREKVAELKHTRLTTTRLRLSFWRPRSGVMQAESGSVTATITLTKEYFSVSNGTSASDRCLGAAVRARIGNGTHR